MSLPSFGIGQPKQQSVCFPIFTMCDQAKLRFQFVSQDFTYIARHGEQKVKVFTRQILRKQCARHVSREHFSIREIKQFADVHVYPLVFNTAMDIPYAWESCNRLG